VGAWVRGCVGGCVRAWVGAWVRACVGGCVGAWVCTEHLLGSERHQPLAHAAHLDATG